MAQQSKIIPLVGAPVQAGGVGRLPRLVLGGLPSRALHWLKRNGSTWAVPLLILAVWQIASSTGLVPTRILPGPLAVLKVAADLWASNELLRDVTVSTQRALTGLIIGGGVGFTLGLLNGTFSLGERLFDTSIQMIRTVPNLALVPLVILWFGIGETGKVFLIALGVFFPIYLNTFHGVRSVDVGLIEMGKVYGLSTRGLFTKVIFPGALPGILVGLRYALGIMWLTLVVAEQIAANAGIGFMTASAREFIRTDIMVFAIVLYALLGKLADLVAKLLERQFLQWHPRYQRVRVSS